MLPAPLSLNRSNYLVTCLLSPYLNLYQASNLLTGLCLLAEQGRIRLRFKSFLEGSKDSTGDPLTIRLNVQVATTGVSRTIIVDLYDRSDRFTIAPLEECDWYFKRSYHTPDVNELPTALRQKVRPFGLNYACRSTSSTMYILAKLAPNYGLRLLRSLSQGISQFQADIHRLQVRGFLRSPKIQHFEKLPTATFEPSVLFQTRLWAADEVGPGENWEEVNESRISIIRALRRAFHNRFVGGVQPTAFAMKYFRDLVTNQPDGRGQYIMWSKRHLIGIYTRGLHHSYAFKLAEYLASSKCIVSAPLRNTLPVPLVAGKHYIEFSSPEHCVEQCQQIFRDHELASSLQEQAWQYYQEQVAPAAQAASFLKSSIEDFRKAT